MNVSKPTRRKLVRILESGKILVEDVTNKLLEVDNRSPLPAPVRVQTPQMGKDVDAVRKLLEGIDSRNARAGHGSCNWRGAR